MDRQLKAFDIILVDFGQEPIDSEQGGIRPAVIVQTDAGNIHSPNTLVLPLTTRIKHLHQPTHVIIKKDMQNGLKQDSVVLGESIMCISKSNRRVKKYIGRISDVNERRCILNALYSGITEEM